VKQDWVLPPRGIDNPNAKNLYFAIKDTPLFWFHYVTDRPECVEVSTTRAAWDRELYAEWDDKRKAEWIEQDERRWKEKEDRRRAKCLARHEAQKKTDVLIAHLVAGIIKDTGHRLAARRP
jgi:hypothetical protein